VNGGDLPEFERRYAAMPHLKKAELIEGIVYMPAALRIRSHGQPHEGLNSPEHQAFVETLR
jgi:hypothetical protein